jgi:hypothetical protein
MYKYININIVTCRVIRDKNKRGFSEFNEGVYLNPCRDYTQQKQHTLSRLIARKHEFSFIAVVDSVLVILGHSLVPCAPESGPQLTWLVWCSLTTDSICVSAIPLYPSAVIPLLSFWPNNASVASDVTMGFSLL